MTEAEALSIVKQLAELREPAGSNRFIPYDKPLPEGGYRFLYDVGLSISATGTSKGGRHYSFTVRPSMHLESLPDWSGVLQVASERNLFVHPAVGEITLSPQSS